MKVDDSGMPGQAYWDSLFDIDGIVDWLDLSKEVRRIVEIGCGYGTFTVPIAMKSAGEIHTFDIEPSMIKIAQENARKAGVSNVIFRLRDVLEQGTDLEPESIDLMLLFNLLHFAEKRILLEEASRILKVGGRVAIIHWRKDIPTPRGPKVTLRPDQGQILEASEGLNLHSHGKSRILAPYHWGIQLFKEEQ